MDLVVGETEKVGNDLVARGGCVQAKKVRDSVKDEDRNGGIGLSRRVREEEGRQGWRVPPC